MGSAGWARKGLLGNVGHGELIPRDVLGERIRDALSFVGRLGGFFKNGEALERGCVGAKLG